MRLRKKSLAVLTLIILTAVLTCCTTTQSVSRAKFPDYEVEERVQEENGNIKEIDSQGNVVFYFDNSSQTVTIPYDYWIRIIGYGIDTGGLDK